MNEEIQDYLRHVLQAIAGVETHLGQKRQFRYFVENLTTRRAVERELEIIGEAITEFSNSTRPFPSPTPKPSCTPETASFMATTRWTKQFCGKSWCRTCPY